MKLFCLNILLLNIIFSCAHSSSDEGLVTVSTALDQAQASYLRGCVDALKSMGVPSAFPGCKNLSNIHRKEIESIMKIVIE
jgi:hypothetical protein